MLPFYVQTSKNCCGQLLEAVKFLQYNVWCNINILSNLLRFFNLSRLQNISCKQLALKYVTLSRLIWRVLLTQYFQLILTLYTKWRSYVLILNSTTVPERRYTLQTTKAKLRHSFESLKNLSAMDKLCVVNFSSYFCWCFEFL